MTISEYFPIKSQVNDETPLNNDSFRGHKDDTPNDV